MARRIRRRSQIVVAIDEWDGVFCRGSEHALRPDEDPAGYLPRLDAKNHTSLTFRDGGDWMLMVGGGNGRFVVTLTTEAQESRTLINPQPDGDDEIELCCGGQWAGFAPRIVVGLDLANRAVREFCAKQVDPELIWEEV